jgi:hypothetical protein
MVVRLRKADVIPEKTPYFENFLSKNKNSTQKQVQDNIKLLSLLSEN